MEEVKLKEESISVHKLFFLAER